MHYILCKGQNHDQWPIRFLWNGNSMSGIRAPTSPIYQIFILHPMNGNRKLRHLYFPLIIH
uniref:Uncharacterized protein n=1 Tax=Onchocerca volvulus TaxID=6282 RepID=A0A8R1Y6X8_ONCVO